jgi:hypothetical protein
MGDYTEAPTAAQAIDRLRKVADGDEAQLAALEKLGYAQGYAPGSWTKEHTLREALQTISRAGMASVSHDAAGTPYTMVGQFPWMAESQWGCIFPNNLDPDIPGGKGWFNSRVYLDYNLRDYEALGARFDGIGLDSLCGYGQFSRANYRRDHFQHADIPLSFAAADKQPVIVGPFGTVEWLRQLADEMHGRGLLLMTNCSWGLTPGWLTFGAPYLDILGAEATQFVDPDFIRAITCRKSCTDLPYNPRPEWEVPWHLLHGIFPGHGNDLAAMAKVAPLLKEIAAAGWEPIAHARAEPTTVRVERFGTGKRLFLVLYNPTDAEVTARLTVDAQGLGLTRIGAVEVLLGEEAEAQGGPFEVKLAPRGTSLLKLEG